MTTDDRALLPPDGGGGPRTPSDASPEARPDERRRRLLTSTALGLAAGLLAGGAAGYGVSRGVLADGNRCDTVGLIERSMPAVVTVFAQGQGASGTGSGALIGTDGTIVTNDHVIAPAGRAGQIRVLLSSGTTTDAALVGTDPTTDLAVLRITGTSFPALRIGDDTPPLVGEQVVALGAPLGLSGTVTAGIVSALNRDVAAPASTGGTTVLVGSIQTDASINPGNSGGPLVNCSGHLVGVNTAISTVPNAGGVAGGGSVGIGFAVPAPTVRRITDELVRNGRATHPTLGLTAAEIPPGTAAASGVPAGLYVQTVVAGGPAATAGVRASDIIERIAGSPATSMSVGQLLGRARVGDRIELVLWRGGAKLPPVTVTLGERS